MLIPLVERKSCPAKLEVIAQLHLPGTLTPNCGFDIREVLPLPDGRYRQVTEQHRRINCLDQREPGGH